MTRIRRAGRDGIALAVTLLALACSGSDEGPVGNTGSIEIAVSPTALGVEQGGSNNVNASLTRRGGFTGVVTLAVTGLPTGVTATITPTQLSGAPTSASVDMTVGAASAPGTYNATITATAQGVSQATATLALTITAAPNYALTVTPAALPIPAGASGNVTVTIGRTNFVGPVTLALANPPAGIAGVFTPSQTTATASSLVVSVASTVPPGSYPLTIQGTATGPGVKSTTLTVTVPPPATGGTDVEFQYCESDAPQFFAYQDGAGAWRAVTASTQGEVTKFAFKLAQGRGGVLAVFGFESGTTTDASAVRRGANRRDMLSRSPLDRRVGSRRLGLGARVTRNAGRFIADSYETDVLFGSTAELVQIGGEGCEELPPTKTITATVTGVTNGQYGITSLGGVSNLFIGGTSTNPVTFTDVPDGPIDFVATRMTSEGTPPDKAFLLRNLNLQDGGVVPGTFDFNAAAMLVPATANASIIGGAGDDLEIFTELVTLNGPSLFWFDLSPSSVPNRPWAGIGSAAMVSGDFHGVVVFGTPRGNTTGDFRVAIKYVGQVADLALALGPAIVGPTTSLVIGGTYPRFRFQGAAPAQYTNGVVIDLSSSGNLFGLSATGAYLTASGNPLAYDITLPDVSGLVGFPAAARLTAGPNDVTTTLFGFAGQGILELVPSPGGEFRAATKGSTITVP